MPDASRLPRWQVAVLLIVLTAGIALGAWFCMRPTRTEPSLRRL